MAKKAPLMLMILDGWGYNKNKRHNAIAHAKTPQWDEWWQTRPHILLEASGCPVGLPDDQMGNSEVGHMHIGAGRVIQQDFTRINQAIAQGEFHKNPLFYEVITHLKQNNKALHLMGLFSDGGVHSHENHLFAFLEVCEQLHFSNVFLHLFLDGRDTPPQSVLASLQRLKQKHPHAKIRSITGRYYAMDRDKRWERIEPVYQLLTSGLCSSHFNDAQEAIEAYYQQGLSDEFIPPTAIGPKTSIEEGDALFFFNFRADRARQLSNAFLNPQFDGFLRLQQPRLSYFVSLTQYDKTLSTSIAFPPISMSNTLGEIIANHHLTQLRIAETEKYAHVTFFFNGGNEQAFAGEERILVPSPKVATYDLQPEMSAHELTQELIKGISEQKYDVIICNYANADMVGHTGNFQAAVQAIECLDQCMQQVWKALESQGGALLITADHGNAEEMFNEHTHQAHTAHTSEPVPFVFVGDPQWHFNTPKGSLVDIAPTLLHVLGLTPPPEMTGRVLLSDETL